MKKLIVISIILFAGFSVSAQDGGRAEVPECYKCIFIDVAPDYCKEILIPVFRPVKPCLHKVIKTDRYNEAHPREPRMLTNPGDYIPNYNKSAVVKKKLF